MKPLSTIAAVASILRMLCGAQRVPERASFALLLRAPAHRDVDSSARSFARRRSSRCHDHGIRAEDRDENTALIPNYRPFRELADTLGRRGIAVLRLDDRGVNGSDGGTSTATSEDFANDIRAGVAYLRTRSEIDHTRIGLVGHSEGGIIAPMIAASDSSIHAIVLMAGMASKGRDIVMDQNRYMIDSVAHVTGAQRDSLLTRASHAVDSLAKASGWQGFFLNYDPKPTASRVRARVLILQGETDRQACRGRTPRRGVPCGRDPECNRAHVPGDESSLRRGFE